VAVLREEVSLVFDLFGGFPLGWVLWGDWVLLAVFLMFLWARFWSILCRGLAVLALVGGGGGFSPGWRVCRFWAVS